MPLQPQFRARTPVLASLAFAVALALTTAASARTEDAPKNTSPPAISGSAHEGQTLIANAGEWANSPSQFAYQWQRCAASGAGCADIAAATRGQYTPTAADVGHTVRVTVTASNASGEASAGSQTTGVVSASAVTPATGRNKAPTIGFLSLKHAGARVYARFRVCDDSSKSVTITERDTRTRTVSFARLFSVTLRTCSTQSRSWVPASRFRARGRSRYVVTLRAADQSGALSRLQSRSVVF